MQGGWSYSNDANGTMLTGAGCSYTWTAENLSAQISSGATTESYVYDAEGERVKRTVGSASTLYVGDSYEIDLPTNVERLTYTLHGNVVAQRTKNGPNAGVAYLHGDHLGSVSVLTNSSGAVVSRQDFGPWGTVRSGGVTQTTRNFTGQRLDGTGLLYYHARMYDPAIGRFVSADTVVPGSADGSMDGVALMPLTVGMQEVGLLAGIAQEANLPLWFQRSAEQRQQTAAPWGPHNAQALNRYAYVQNNPLKYRDLSGHSVYLTHDEAAVFSDALVNLADLVSDYRYDAAEALVAQVAKLIPVVGTFLSAAISIIRTLGWKYIAKLRELSDRIDELNGEDGVAIGGGGNTPYGFNLYVLDRSTGDMAQVRLGYALYTWMVPQKWDIGNAFGDHPQNGAWWFEEDTDGKTDFWVGCLEGAVTC